MVLEQGVGMESCSTLRGGELINREGTVGPWEKENQQYNIEFYTSELPSGEREHSQIRKDNVGKRWVQGAGLVSEHESPLEQAHIREEEDTAPAHCTQRILSRPRVTTTELLQQNPNTAGGWAPTFRPEMKHEEKPAWWQETRGFYSEKNLALSLRGQNLKMDRMNIIQWWALAVKNYFHQNRMLAQNKMTSFSPCIPKAAARLWVSSLLVKEHGGFYINLSSLWKGF